MIPFLALVKFTKQNEGGAKPIPSPLLKAGGLTWHLRKAGIIPRSISTYGMFNQVCKYINPEW